MTRTVASLRPPRAFTNAHQDGVLADGNSYWYVIDAVNSCGAVP